MVKCIVCGKELTGNQQKYCSPKCALKAFKQGKATPHINQDKKIEELYKQFKNVFWIDKFNHLTNVTGWKLRVFSYLAIRLKGYSISGTARATGKNHSTIIHHLKGVKPEEKEIAYTYLETKTFNNTFNYKL